MYATRSNPSPNASRSTRSNLSQSADASRPRKKHVHAECGEPIKGHRRVNGTLVCHGIEPRASPVASEGTSLEENNGVQLALRLSELQPGTLEDLESAMERTLELVRDTLKTRGFSRRMPGMLHELRVQRRGAHQNPSWAEVAVTAVDTLRDVLKFTLVVVVLLVWIFSYFTRNDLPKPSSTCTPS
ncbi:hypothetical protein C8R47DRAFT_1072375 [Mycena vitilis]|nr:hypothetical protein C8R47DRAFT_1072375 [Mycena vitilis]